MGLHNKFPSYFYKRGNLFNTYLGHTDGTEPPVKKKASEWRPRKQRTQRRTSGSTRIEPRDTLAVAPPSRPFRPSPAAQRLVDFSREHMSVEETGQFLRLITRKRGQALTPVHGPEVWDQLAYFASICLRQNLVDTYFLTLKQRQEAGEPLIQK